MVLGKKDGPLLGTFDGLVDGRALGDLEGLVLGTLDGAGLGLVDGSSDGLAVVGAWVGWALGVADGWNSSFVGICDGDSLGPELGEGFTVGRCDGISLGKRLADDGASVGAVEETFFDAFGKDFLAFFFLTAFGSLLLRKDFLEGKSSSSSLSLSLFLVLSTFDDLLCFRAL